MSAVLVAVFTDHVTANSVRSRLVSDGFPTDRVELTSLQEMGQAKLVPRDTASEQLVEYFRLVLHGEAGDEHVVQLLQRAVIEGKAALTVQPRGETETQRALQLLNEGDAIDLRAADLDQQAMEHAAADKETPIITWMGKVLAGPGAPDTTGTARLP